MATEAGEVALPVDLLHLVAQQLAENGDFSTLFNCVVSSKQLAGAGAISALYKISHNSPVKSGGNEAVPFAEQELNVQKWSILWRTIILSTMGKTLYPYCRHLRTLDLNDLGNLLDDDKFRGSISKHFFAGDLAHFHFILNTPARTRTAARLDRNRIITAIGEEITQHSPLLEELSEPMLLPTLSTALLTWTPRLGHLRRLVFFDGKAFADETIRNLLHAHCPNLEALTLYSTSHSETDHVLGTFIRGMPENKLTYFESIGDIGVGPETCLALNGHRSSLSTLELRLGDGGILALGLLKGCTALQKLSIGSDRGYGVDLKAMQNDVYLEIVEWLKSCTKLKKLELYNIASAPHLVTPLLSSGDVELERLSIDARNEEASYLVKDHHDFHRALGGHVGLRSLLLRAELDPPSRDDIEILMDTFCSLRELRHLNLTRVADWFNDDNISLLGQCLPNLESLCVGSFGVGDAALDGLVTLENLTQLTFSSLTRFTSHGLSQFIEQLREGNNEFVLSIESADPDNSISEDEQAALRELIQVKLDGRFEYQLLRDPNVPDFDTEGSD